MIENQFYRVKYQVLATCIGNLVVFGQGCNIGWFSPSLPILRSVDFSPLSSGPLNDDEVGWIGSMSAFGAMSGTLIFGSVVSAIGFKRALLLTTFPLIVSWLLIIYAQNSWYIMASRFVVGFSGGGTFLCIPQFVAEIADDFIRGQLNSYIMMIFYSGLLAGFIGGSYMDYYTNQYVMLIIPVIFVFLFALMPETPQFLLRKGRVEEAEKSLRFYRNCQRDMANKSEETNVQTEFVKLQAIAQQNSEAPSICLADFFTGDALKAYTITICLLFVNQWSGSFIMSNYAATIFMESGSHLDSNSSAIIMATCQVFGNYMASQLIDRIGRRSLHIISASGCSVALSVTGAYVYLVRHGHDLSAYSWLPVMSLSFFIFICAIGVIPVPFIIMTEVMPSKIRKIGVMACTCISFALQFAVFKLFPYFMNSLQLYGCMWLFASVTAFGVMFSLFVVQETKGRNLDVLQMEARKNSRISC